MKPYLQLLKQGFSEISVYSIDFLLGTLQSITMVGSNIFIWLVVFPQNDEQPIHERITYLILVNGIAMLIGATRGRLSKEIMETIKTGILSRYLLRPLSPLAQLIAEHFGARANEFLVGGVFTVIGILSIQNIRIDNLPYFIIAMLAAISITTAMNISLAAVALWSTEADGILYAALQFIRMLNGTSVPLQFIRETLGNLVANILILLPFASLAYTPTRMLTVTTITQEDYLYLFASIVWGVAFPLIAQFIWKRGIVHYEAVGA